MDDIAKHSGLPKDHFLSGRWHPDEHNEYDYRTSLEMKENRDSIVCLGCSFTYGQSVTIENTWPYILGQKLNRPSYNLGRPGGSMDSSYRILNAWLPVLKSKDVFILNCFRRREFYLDTLKKFMPIGPGFPGFLANTENSLRPVLLTSDIQYNLDKQKTMRAIKNLCNEFDSKLHFIDYEDCLNTTSFVDFGDDGQHPGPKQQLIYAENFYDKIQNN